MAKFDLKTIHNRERPLSWSAISAFEWNPKQWHDKYVLKIKPVSSPEMDFGNWVDKKVQNEPEFLPDLVRYPVMQHEMRAIFDGIPLIGIADTYHPGSGFLRDYKTGRNIWDQKRANETGQLTMYSLLLYYTEKAKPENLQLFIDWLPTHIHQGEIDFRDDPVKIYTFKTKRDMRTVLQFGQRIKETWKKMEEYASRAAQYSSESMKDW